MIEEYSSSTGCRDDSRLFMLDVVATRLFMLEVFDDVTSVVFVCTDIVGVG